MSAYYGRCILIREPIQSDIFPLVFFFALRPSDMSPPKDPPTFCPVNFAERASPRCLTGGSDSNEPINKGIAHMMANVDG